MGWHVGLVGSGGWSRVHLRALSASPRVERITLSGRNAVTVAERAAEFDRVTATVDDYRRLLDDPSIALVQIVTPHDLHAEIALAALAAGKHVICEKPGAVRLADFDQCQVLAARNGLTYRVVMNHLYNPVVLKVRELIDAGAVGQVRLAVENSFTRHERSNRQAASWRSDVRRAGGGVLIDGGFHMVYRHLFQLAEYGAPSWVTAESTPRRADRGESSTDEGEGFMAITVGYARALRIQWAHAWMLAAAPVRARQHFIVGTEGTLEFTDREEAPLVVHRDGASEASPLAVGPRTGPETTAASIVDYVDCLARGVEPAHARMELARTTLEIILAAYASAAAPGRISIG